MSDPFAVKKIPNGYNHQSVKLLTVDNLLNKILALKAFRKEIRQFLDVVHKRELILRQMHVAVNAIQNVSFFSGTEEDDAAEVYMNKYDEETKKRIAAAKKAAFEAEDPREEMRAIGNKLVNITESMLKKVSGFFKAFNKIFAHVRIDQFIF